LFYLCNEFINQERQIDFRSSAAARTERYPWATRTLCASTNASGARLDSDKSLYVGARPDGGFNVHNVSYPRSFWKGAVDEVRVSRGALRKTIHARDRSQGRFLHAFPPLE
jgi:hypothetical protein